MSSTDVAPQNTPVGLAIKGWDTQIANLIKATILRPSRRDASDAELAFFAEQCKRTGLDPFTGQIYGIYRFDKRVNAEVLGIQVAIDGLRLQGERTGKYEGQVPIEWCGTDGKWTDVWLQNDPPAAARAGVYKAGMREPLYAVARWVEFRQTGPMWERMPSHMLGKCAEALALRKAFPNETSGLLTPEETGAEIPGAGSAQTARPSGGTVTLPATNGNATTPAAEEPEEVTAEHVEPPVAVEADAPAATVHAATPAQRRLIFKRQKDGSVSDEALRDVFRIVAGTPHSERIPKDRVDEVLEVVTTLGACGLSGEDAQALLAEAAGMDPLPSAIALCEALDNPEEFWASRDEAGHEQAALEVNA